MFQCAITPGSPSGALAATVPPITPDEVRSIVAAVATIQTRNRDRRPRRGERVVETNVAIRAHLSLERETDRVSRCQVGRLRFARLGAALPGAAVDGACGSLNPGVRMCVPTDIVVPVSTSGRQKTPRIGEGSRFSSGYRRGIGGAKGARTPDLLNAIQTLSQLSYSPAPERER
jgi:hypothetical protein